MATIPQRNILTAVGKKCYCFPGAVCTKVALEKSGVTECIVSSLNFTNADAILSLTENYLTEKYLAFSSVTLKALISFMLNSTFLESQKKRVVQILDDQLRFHPGCASYMKLTYEKLLLNQDDDFIGLTIMDYVLSQFEHLLSKQYDHYDNNQIFKYFSIHRTSRRPRKQKLVFEELEKKISKLDCVRQLTNEPVDETLQLKSNDIYNLVLVLNFLTDILKHELGSILCRNEDVKNSIICRLLFKFETLSCLNMLLLSKAFISYKYCTGVQERCLLLKLIELMAEVCLLVDGEENIDLKCSKRYFGTFVSEFIRLSLSDQCESQASEMIVDLKPEILRYRATHSVLEKIWDKRIPVGLKGVWKTLITILKTGKNTAVYAEYERRLIPCTRTLQYLDANQQQCIPGTYSFFIPFSLLFQEVCYKDFFEKS